MPDPRATAAGEPSAEMYLAMLLEQLPALVWSTDEDLRVTFSAGSGVERLGFEREALTGRLLSEIYAASADAMWLNAHRRALEGASSALEGTFRGRFWDVRLDPLMSPERVVIGVLGIAVEISDLAAARRDASERLTALERIDEERRRLLVELAGAARSERVRISREVHDDLGQLLTSAALQAAALRSEVGDAAEQAVEHLQVVLEDALVSMHQTVTSLREPPAAGGDLVGALGKLVEPLAAHVATIDIHHAGVTDPLPGLIATAAYRVIQESLTNAVKHAAATTVSITILQSETRLTVVIEDDGQGFCVGEEPTVGLGLAGMAERAREIGGQLTVDSSLGRGTAVRLEAPLSERSP